MLSRALLNADLLRACHRWHTGDRYAKGRVEHDSALLADHSRDVTKLTAEQPSADKRDARLYVQDTRQFVGNCVM
ncbi:hypothetical protein [Cupriavidus basilensis]|uniref:hypothetical protein n=1 Tax=Cupriavidus basilensis TaxID=68895 RepID=UPI0039F68626